MYILLLTILPLSRCWIDIAKELIVGDGLGVKVLPDGLQLHDLVGLVERAQDPRLAGTGIPDDKDGMPHVEQLLQLDYLQNKVILGLQTKLLQNGMHVFRVQQLHNLHNPKCFQKSIQQGEHVSIIQYRISQATVAECTDASRSKIQAFLCVVQLLCFMYACTNQSTISACALHHNGHGPNVFSLSY